MALGGHRREVQPFSVAQIHPAAAATSRATQLEGRLANRAHIAVPAVAGGFGWVGPEHAVDILRRAVKASEHFSATRFLRFEVRGVDLLVENDPVDALDAGLAVLGVRPRVQKLLLNVVVLQVLVHQQVDGELLGRAAKRAVHACN